MSRRMAALAAGVVAALLMLSGCSGGVPADPDGSLERVAAGTLRVGVSHNPPWTELHDAGDPTGTEVDLVTRYAERIGAEVDWTEGSEAPLAAALERGDLDLVIAGLLDDTPWVDRAAVTAAYTESRDPDGSTRKHVMLTPMGENALLVDLERFLREAAR